MKKVDWYYQRKGCKTCAKSDAFLSLHQIEVTEVVDCKKHLLGQGDLKPLLSSVTQVQAVRGPNVRTFEAPFDYNEVLVAILGPTGNLRAPTIRQGQRLYVGFDSDLYNGLLSP